MSDLGMDGTRANVYGMKEMSWIAAELFGSLHLMVPSLDVTVCGSVINPNGEKMTVKNISVEITCHECSVKAYELKIPTA
jgi:hypothetical protein